MVDSELAHRGHAAFLAEAALAIAIQGYLMSVRNFVAVGQTVAERGYRNGAERRTGYDFSVVHSVETEQLDAFTEGRWRKIAFRLAGMEGAHTSARWWWRLLRSADSRAERKRAPEDHAHD